MTGHETGHQTGHETGPKKSHVASRGTITVMARGGAVGHVIGTRTNDMATTKTGLRRAVT